MSCIFTPKLFRHFHVLHFHVTLSGPSFSGLAFSGGAFSAHPMIRYMGTRQRDRRTHRDIMYGAIHLRWMRHAVILWQQHNTRQTSSVVTVMTCCSDAHCRCCCDKDTMRHFFCFARKTPKETISSARDRATVWSRCSIDRPMPRQRQKNQRRTILIINSSVLTPTILMKIAGVTQKEW